MSFRGDGLDNQAKLAQLTASAVTWHRAVESALGNVLEHAMHAGDDLLAMRELVPPGQWQAYLRANTDISERSARVYIRVAKARTELSGSTAAGRPLSLRAALKYLQDDPEGSRKRPGTKPKPKLKKPAAPLDALGWWSSASLEQRQHFLDGAGLPGILSSLPTEWRPLLEEQAVGHLSTLRLLDLLERRLERDGINATAQLQKIRDRIVQSRPPIDLAAVPVSGSA
jgi:hypothetical protein